MKFLRKAVFFLVPFLLTAGVVEGQVRTSAGMEGDEEGSASLFLITSLAESGQASAQSLLGEMRLTGAGVSRDYAEALKWFRAAAEQGDSHALGMMGLMYESGFGVEPDPAQAEFWYQRAVKCGDLLSSYRMGPGYARMNIP